MRPRSAVITPYPAVITIPKCAHDGTSDYESELCLVIGKTGWDISEDDALDHVLGYTASNDVSARSMHLITAQWRMSKGLDSSCPISPVLVAPSIIPDPQALVIKGIYNAITTQDRHTRFGFKAIIHEFLGLLTLRIEVIFNIHQQISYLSKGTVLEARTIFLTGTPDGIGSGTFASQQSFLKMATSSMSILRRLGL